MPIIPHINEADYHADRLADVPSLSSGTARTILSESPLHAWTDSQRLNPHFIPTIKDTFDFGRAAHALILGAGAGHAVYPPELLDARGYATTKAAKEWEAETRAAGLTPIKAADEARMIAMADVMHGALKALGLALDPDVSEVCALAEVDGTFCRALIDNAPAQPVNIPGLGKRRVLIDFKTCESAAPEAITSAVERYGYDVQWRHYVETWQAATGEPDERVFIFLFQEKQPPHEICPVILLAQDGHSEDWSAAAREKIATARSIWSECLRTNTWPGYPRVYHQIGARSGYADAAANVAARAAQSRQISTATLAAARMAQAPEGFRL
jgi:hypothetical protein